MIAEMLRRNAEAVPRRAFLRSGGESLDYAGATAAVAALATALRDRALSRFAICARDSTELVLLVLAAACAGSEVSILSCDGSENELADLCCFFGFETLVTDTLRDRPIGDTAVLAIDELLPAFGPSPARRCEPADARIMILTTGTTGRPKGAVYSWARLMAQARLTPQHDGKTWLLAYHLNHFAGIQMLCHVVANRGTLAIPMSREVADSITTMRELGVTHVSATPTFWRFALALLEENPAEAPPLEHITLGAEATPAALLESLRAVFPAARISQVFAATEVGSCVSVRDGEPGLPASILDRGDEAEVRFKIVDGELFVRAKNGMLGYFGEVPRTDAAWRATGDLVERHGDRLLFVGRKTETINVGGVKVHPLPIEARAQAVEGVALVRAYGKANPITGQIVAIDVVAREGEDPRALEKQLRAAFNDLAPHGRPRLIRFVSAIETRNQKIVRRST